METTTKFCVKCNQQKSIEDFYKNSSTTTGVASYCKTCHLKVNSLQNKAKKLNAKDFKDSYKDRGSNISESLKRKYADDPDYKNKISKSVSKAIISQDLTSNEIVEFESAVKAKSFGFDNTRIGIAIKNKTPYKNKLWKFKNEK